MFEAHRANLASTAADLVPASLVDLKRAVRQQFHEDERRRVRSFSEVDEYDIPEILETLREDEVGLGKGLNENTQYSMILAANDLLAKRGLCIDRESAAYWKLVDDILRAKLEGVRRAIQWCRGNPRQRCVDPLFSDIDADNPPSSGGLTLRELIEAYENDPRRRNLTDKTLEAYGTVFRALQELLGQGKRARDITREDCRRVQEIFCSLPPNASKRLPGLKLEQAAAIAKERGWPPLHHKTATNYLNNLAALFNWGVKEGYIDRNPASGMKVAAPPRPVKSRLPFSTDQLNQIFNASLYLMAEGDSESRGGRFWVPLLSLWTGMRLNECVQLRTDDVAVMDGVDVILVREDEEGDKRLKTGQAKGSCQSTANYKKSGCSTTSPK